MVIFGVDSMETHIVIIPPSQNLVVGAFMKEIAT